MRSTPTFVAGALLLAVVAGCGDADVPADRVPALDASLTQVVVALENGDEALAGRHLRAIIRDTRTALTAGKLEAVEAATILQTAERLLAALAPPPAATTPAEPQPEPKPEPKDDEEDEGARKDEEKDEKKDDEG